MCLFGIHSYGGTNFSANYASNAPAGVVVRLNLSKGSFAKVAGSDASGDVTTDASSTTNDTGSALFLFSTSPYQGQAGSNTAQIWATSSWCNSNAVPITLAG